MQSSMKTKRGPTKLNPWIVCLVVSVLLLFFLPLKLAWGIAMVLALANLFTALGGGGAVGWHSASFRENERRDSRQFLLPSAVSVATLYLVYLIFRKP